MRTAELGCARRADVGVPPTPPALQEQPGTKPGLREMLRGTVASVPGGAVPELMTIKNICKEAGIGRTTAYREIQLGGLRAFKIGRRTVIKRDDFYNWIASLKPALPAGGSVMPAAAAQEERGAGRAAR